MAWAKLFTATPLASADPWYLMSRFLPWCGLCFGEWVHSKHWDVSHTEDNATQQVFFISSRYIHAHTEWHGNGKIQVLVPALGRQRLGDHYEFKPTAMVYIAISGPARLHGETVSKQTDKYLSVFVLRQSACSHGSPLYFPPWKCPVHFFNILRGKSS